jgi:hypothetical protein
MISGRYRKVPPRNNKKLYSRTLDKEKESCIIEPCGVRDHMTIQ